MMIDPADLFGLQQLLADYWLHLDRVVEGPSETFFTEDGEVLIGTLELRGFPAIEAFYVDRRAQEDVSGRRTRHLCTNLLVKSVDGDSAELRFLITVFAGVGPMPLPSSVPSNIGDFAATCRKGADGQWRLQSLRATAAFAGPGAPPNVR